MNDIIICRLDGKEMLTKHLARHLKLYHKKNYKEYIKEHIEDFNPQWNLCPICNNAVKGKACSGNCLSQYYSNIRIGIPKGAMSEETKKKLSNGKKQKYKDGWAPRVGKFHSEKTKNNISKIRKKQLSDPKNHPFFGKHHTQETKEKISKEHIDSCRYVGSNNPMFGKTHTPETIKKIMSHRPMNKLERLVADELDKLSISYYFQYFITENGVCKSYDFKIKGKPLILEIDGDFWHGNPNTNNHHIHVKTTILNDKLKEEMAGKRGIKVIRLWESDINNDPSIVERSVACLV